MATTSAANSTTWVDITDFVQWQGPPTGIQRVIHEFGIRVLNSQGRVNCCRFDADRGTLITAPNTALSDPFDSRTPLVPTANSVEPPRRRLRGLFDGPFVSGREVSTAQIQFTPGDRLVVIGANWLTPHYAQHLTTLAADVDLEITQVMYDLIPSMYPQWAATGAASIVTPFLAHVLPVCRNIICISDNTRHDVEEFVSTHGLALRSDVNIRVVRLGGTPSASADVTSNEMPAPPGSLDPTEPFILCVGTLEVRKNQYVLYQAYREALRLGIALPKLYCVGRIGWLAEATEHAIRHDHAINSSIKILETVSDAHLEWLYQHCIFTVYPSLYEGWGLPVGESLSHQKVCITTRQASLPEVGGDLADYASPFSSTDWLDAITTYLDPTTRSHREAAIREGYERRTWDVAGAEFCDAIGIASILNAK